MTFSLKSGKVLKCLFAAIPLAGVVLSILIAVSIYYSAERIREGQFTRAVENRFFAFKREIDSNLDVLASIQALYSSSAIGIERPRFQAFTRQILKQRPTIQALEWIPHVPDSLREDYEETARSEGFPDFQITERLAQGKMRRAGQRKEYFPVYFVEPYQGNELALGFDLASDPTRLAALEASWRSGAPLATARITLVQETKSQFGMIIFAPIYRAGAVIDSDQGRRDNLAGFALGVFRIGDIAEKSLTYLKPEGVDFTIHDETASEPERFLYTHSSRTRQHQEVGAPAPKIPLLTMRTLEVAGRKWNFTYSATPEFMAAGKNWLPWGFLAGGLAFTCLATGFLFVVARHAERVEKFAADLEEREERYRSFVQNFQGIAFKGTMDFSFLFIHGAVREITGYSPEEFLAGLRWDRLIPPADLKGVYEGGRNLRKVPGTSLDREYRIIRKDGEIRWIREMISNVCDPSGQPWYVNGAIYDITAGKLAEKKLVEQRGFLTNVLNSIQDGISILDRDFRILKSNPTIEQVFRQKMPLVGRLCYEAYHDRSAPCDPCPSMYTLESGKPGSKIFPMEVEGEQVWLELYTFPFYDMANSQVDGVVEYTRNITERKKMEDELAESRRFTDQVINSIGEGLIVYDQELRCRLWNPYMERLTGYGAEKIVGNHPLQFFPFLHEEGVLDSLKQTLEGREVRTIDFPYTIPETGRKGWVSHANSRLRNARGEVIGVMATVRDITEYKRSEQALLAEKTFTENSLNTIIDTFFVFDLRGKFLRWNNSLCAVTGYGNEEIPWMNPTDFFPADEVPKVQAAIEQVVREGCATLETTIATRDGRRLPYELKGTILRDPDGAALGISGIGRDISERKKAEEELRKSREFIRNILETVDEGFIVIDPDFRILSVNKAYLDMIGKREQEALGTYCYTLSHKLCKPCCEAGENCPVSETLRTGENRIATHTHHDEAGRQLIVEIKSFPVRDEAGRIIAAIEVINNVTEKKELEDQLHQAQKMEAIGTLAGGIAHDFNNILTAIVGYAELAREETDEQSMAQEDMLRVIAAASRATDLVRQILTISRQGAQQKQPVRIQYILKEAIQFLRPTISSYIRIETDIDPGCREIMADPTEIHQVIMNLCTNAYHAMREIAREDHVMNVQLTEVDLDRTAALKLEQHLAAGRFVKLTVSDTGCGMNEKVMARIFDPYFTTKKQGHGTGLGLAVVHGIVKDCGGAVSVESVIGKGTTFAVYLPVSVTEIPAMNHSKKGDSAVSVGGNERILVIDDEDAIVQLLQRSLEKVGYQVSPFTECDEAIQQFTLRPKDFDLIITDMNMPKLMGMDLAQACRAIRPDIPIIMCTGFSEKEDKGRAKEIGIREVLDKPVDREELVRLVRRILDERKS